MTLDYWVLSIPRKEERMERGREKGGRKTRMQVGDGKGDKKIMLGRTLGKEVREVKMKGMKSLIYLS